MNTEIEVSTLGRLRIQHNRKILEDFISVKAVLLFVYLAMHPGEHTRKKLAAMFWSETNNQQALKNLRTVLSSLRQKLPDALSVGRDDLAINPQTPIQVDASLFERGCVNALSSSNRAELWEEMQSLAELYRGAFLADVSFREADALDEWIADKQRHLQNLYTQLLYEIVELAQQRTDYETGIRYARRLTSLDPYWDAACRQLMRLLTFTNRSNEALLQYEAFAKLLAADLDATPEEETIVLYEQIRSQNIRPHQQRTPHSSIVLPDMPFVEAVDDVALVQRMLNTPQCHLLTVYGISGIGKTALVTQVAFHRQHLYRDGAYLVSLKRAQTARDLPYLIASSLGIDFVSQITFHELENVVLEYLKDRHVLLVLDNYDHLLPETSFVQRILELASPTQLVVTSQSPLNLFREWLLPLRGLRVPPFDEAHPETYESVRLFELTAQRIDPRFNLQENLVGVVEICYLVDGLPLALIIAAGWTQIIPIHKIKEYIIEGQEFSLPLQQDLPLHHQSLEMMLEYTWNTLSAAEQYALMALSIFKTSFDIDEVQQICDIELAVLTAMIQKSLIQKYADKYRMHQLIWRYARKKLLYSDRKEALGQRYMGYMIRLLSDLQQQRLPLHEYLLTIEMQYASIWNYDWMAKSFQPFYMLTLSCYLIAYWEISRSDELPLLQVLFDDLHPNELDAEARTLLNVQLARLHIWNDQPEQAYLHLRLILHENAVNTSWADWAATFNLCIPIFRFVTLNQSDMVSDQIDEDVIILGNSYRKLLSLYLDMHDYEAAEGVFPHLLESVQQPLDHVFILAMRGAIAAETQQFAAAYNQFTESLQHLQQVDEPLLKLSLHTLTMRIAHRLGLPEATRQHLFASLRLAAESDTAPAMLQLLTFCAELPHITSDQALVRYTKESIHHLQAHSPGKRPESNETLTDMAERVIAMADDC